MPNDRSELVLPDGTVIPVPPGPPRPARFVQTREQPIQKLRWTHDLAIDMMLQNPEWDQRRLAQYFGYSDAWVCMVIASDGFQAKLAERRDEVLNPEVKLQIEERFRALANHSLSRLHEKLENPNASDNLVLRSVELAAKALGLGARAPMVSANVQVAIVVPPKEARVA
jgi:hypothetical protein